MHVQRFCILMAGFCEGLFDTCTASSFCAQTRCCALLSGVPLAKNVRPSRPVASCQMLHMRYKSPHSLERSMAVCRQRKVLANARGGGGRTPDIDTVSGAASRQLDVVFHVPRLRASSPLGPTGLPGSIRAQRRGRNETLVSAGPEAL